MQPHSGELRCATTVDNSGVYLYYLKGTVSVYFVTVTVGFSGTGTNMNTDFISERELTFTFVICHRPSVCLSSVCLSSVCL